MSAALLLNALSAGSVYALVALGFAVIYRTARFFHFAHGAVYTFGAYIAYFLRIQVGLPVVVALPIACGVAALLGVVIELTVYRPMRRRAASDLALLIASLGAYTIVQNALAAIWGNSTRSIRTGWVVEGYEILGGRISSVQVSIILASILLIALLELTMSKTRFGATLRALAEDPELARLSGVNTERQVVYAFGIGSGLAAIAAIMISFDTDMSPIMGFSAIVKGVIAVVIAGRGGLPVVALSGVFLAVAENASVYWFPVKWQDTVAFAVLILFLVLRPYGMQGQRPAKVHV